METIDRALAAAVLARTIRMGLRRPADAAASRPEDEAGAALRQAAVPPRFEDEACAALRQAAAVLDDGGSVAGSIAGAVERLLSVPAEDPQDLAGRHASLFGHSLRGRICPYETEYGGGAPFRQSQDLADISGYYLAFGLTPARAGDVERVDHAACELEYFEFLRTKEAWAIQEGDTEMLEVTRDAAAGFLKDHLGRFGVAFGATLSREDPHGYYGRLGELCVALLKAECQHLGLPAGPEFMQMRSTEDDGVPMACGSGSCPATGPDEDDLVTIGSPKASG